MGKIEKSLFIVEQLSHKGRLSLKEINERFELSPFYDGEIIPRSFTRYKDFIMMTWGILIEYDHSDGRYYISNEEFVNHTDLYKYLLSSVYVSNLASAIMRNKDRVHFSSLSTGTDNLYAVIMAIETKHSIEFDYYSYVKQKSSHQELLPCFVQEWEGRWYMIAEPLSHKTPAVYALERMSNVHVGDTSDTPYADIDPNVYFNGSFGINHEDRQIPEEIRIKVYDTQVDYIKAKPLHPSQKEIAKGDGWTIFSYQLVPNYNFYQQVLWHREKVEIVAPIEMRNEIKSIINKTFSLYL